MRVQEEMLLEQAHCQWDTPCQHPDSDIWTSVRAPASLSCWALSPHPLLAPRGSVSPSSSCSPFQWLWLGLEAYSYVPLSLRSLILVPNIQSHCKCPSKNAHTGEAEIHMILIANQGPASALPGPQVHTAAAR